MRLTYMSKLYLFLILTLMVVCGCGKDKDAEQQNNLTGTWYLSKQVVDRYTRLDPATHTETEYTGKTYFLKLEASGKCSMKLTEEPNGESTYIIDGQVLHMKLEDLYGERIFIIKENTSSVLRLSRIFQNNDVRTETELTFKK
jgi:hypothetical protein